MAAVVGLVKDLLDRSRIQGMAKAVGSSVTFVSSLDELENIELGAETTIFVDLTDKELDGIRVPEILKQKSAVRPARVIGFISHQDKEGIAAAQNAKFDEVLTRAAFFKRLSVLLAEARDIESAKKESNDREARDV